MRPLTLTLLILLLLIPRTYSQEPKTADICIYGATSAGVIAAIQAKKMGKSVILLEPSEHVGGLTSGGLGFTDSGDKSVIGGLSREFYQRVKKYYDDPKVWTLSKRETYPQYRAADDAMWTFEPKVAERILLEMLKEQKIDTIFKQRLDRTPNKGVVKKGAKIESIKMESGQEYGATIFLDCTYEGDLLAAAGVEFTVGREANSKYNETLNGVQTARNTHNHRFVVKVDPFKKQGDKTSGLLFGIEKDPLPEDGQGDHRVQAYCYRLCMTDVEANRIAWPKPKNYDESLYELLFRNFEAGDLRIPMKPDRMPNGKTDTNNNCAFSTDFIGQSNEYPNASYADREKILQAHEDYQKGLMWSLANHKRVPEKIRAEFSRWGLPKDEFEKTQGWPHQIYVREARRMVGAYVNTENDCTRKVNTPCSVGMGSYNMDSHNCARYVTKEGFVQNEGDIQVSPGGAYPISYRALTPKEKDCENLLVPVCLSSSHIAYGSIRMEPVFMILGQSAAVAAVMAINGNVSVQKIDETKLTDQLKREKQVLDAPRKSKGIDPKSLKGIVVDDEQAERKGFTTTSSANPPYIGFGYRHDGNTDRGKQWAKFVPQIPETGEYEVRVYYSPNDNRSTEVPVTVSHTKGNDTFKIDQRNLPKGLNYRSLGKFTFEKGKTGSVTISNSEAPGYVVIDAVEWLPVK